MTTQAYATSVYKEFDLIQFTGLNNKYAPMHIANTEASDLMNVVFDENGAITKRNGYTALNTTQIDGNPIVSLFPFYKSDGTKVLIATSGTSIYKWTGTSWSAIKTGLSANGARFTAATFYDKVYMLNGNAADGLMVWDGINPVSQVVNAVSGVSVPVGQYVVVHKNRLYIAGDPNNPSTIYMSDLGLPDSWPALNLINVNQNDGDRITGLAELADTLVIFKERSMHVLRGTGPQNYSLLDSHQNHGTVSHWSIVQAKNVLFYLSRDGVYEFNGHTIGLVSDKIQGSVLGLNDLPEWNQPYLNLACGIDYKNKYWLAVPEGNSAFTNNRVYVYDYQHSIWTRFDIPISVLTVFESSDGHILYSGDTQNGTVYTQDTGGNDNGNAIDAYFTSKAIDFGATAHFKSYKDFFFFAAQQLQGYSINVSYIADFGRKSKTVPMSLGSGTASKWGTMVWGGNNWGAIPNVAARTTNISGQSRYIQFKVEGNGKDQPFVFYGWAIRYNVKKRMR